MNVEPFRTEPQGITLGPNRKHCYACANILDVRAELCPKCGVRQPPLMHGHVSQVIVAQPASTVAPSSKSKMAAALLAFFLGGLGIHKFYLGQSGAGIVYLLLCWTFIPSIVAFVEFLILLTMSDTEFNRRYP